MKKEANLHQLCDDDIQLDNIDEQQRIAEDEILQLSAGEDVPEFERIDDVRTSLEFEKMIEEDNAISITEEQLRVELEEQYCHLQDLQREDDKIQSIHDNLSLHYSEREIMERAKEMLTDQEVCVICLNEFQINNLVVVDCGHRFCSPCMNLWVQQHTNCPICRKNVPIFIKYRTIRVTVENCSPNYNNLGCSLPDYWVEEFDLVYNRRFIFEMVSYYGRHHQEEDRESPWWDYRGNPCYDYGRDLMFIYNGNMISSDDTPMSLGMQDGDCIIIKHKVIMLIKLPPSRFSVDYDYEERCYDCLTVKAFCREYMKAWNENGDDYYYTYGDIILNTIEDEDKERTMSMLLNGGGGTIRIFVKQEVHEQANARQSSENITADLALIETLYEMKNRSRH
jgi:hypothetical protein